MLFQIVLLILFSIFSARAAQNIIVDYKHARPLFWSVLYPDGGSTLYCRQHFKRNIGLQVEHVYPMSWIANHLNCRSRKACRTSRSEFNRMEADLHNLYPSRAGANIARSNMVFGIIPGEAREFGTSCDFEINTAKTIAEPPPPARGNIARSIFYMHREYGLPIKHEFLSILKAWNLDDPPSSEEHRRNSVIQKTQGTRNPFIDDPALASQLR